MIQTIKLKKDEYFTIDKIEPKPYFLIGGRGTGKSYLAKHYIKDMLINSNFETKYMYVRIREKELPTHDSWIGETDICNCLPEPVEGARIVRGKPYGGAVSIAYSNILGAKEIQHIGYVASLESSALIKSGTYADVGCIVFEEFIRRGMSGSLIDDYCFNFAELIETVMRDRKIPIFFIANSLNAYNPLLELFEDYEVYKIFSEKRRENIKEGKFTDYLRGETYRDKEYNINDFEYLTTIKMNDNRKLSIYCDRYLMKDFLITSKNNTNQERPDLLYMMKAKLIYGFNTLNFIFDSDATEIYFYKNTPAIKTKLRNKIPII